LPDLPAGFGLPVLIVQHMPPIFTKSLAEDLNKKCQLDVREASDGHKVRPGQILIAPGGKQMKVERKPDGVYICITNDPAERSCRPSADYLFRSVAEAYGGSATAVVMTGMGDDGTEGCRLIKRRGGKIIAQDEASCVVYGMPRQVVEAGLADIVCTLARIPDMMQRVDTKGVAR
jgi:two-component system chemotaxis response regulator CheB